MELNLKDMYVFDISLRETNHTLHCQDRFFLTIDHERLYAPPKPVGNKLWIRSPTRDIEIKTVYLRAPISERSLRLLLAHHRAELLPAINKGPHLGEEVSLLGWD